MKKAIFPGTFDPFTLGHLDILNRSTLIFDEIIIGIGINGDKRTMFNIDQRIDMIESIIKDQNGNLGFENTPQAQNAGLEVEARLHLKRWSTVLKNWQMMGNFTWTYSQVTLSEEQANFVTSKSRALQGQSPYVANFGLSYEPKSWSINLFYNVFGPRILDVGMFGIPDVYERPFHSLDLTASWNHKSGLSIGLSAQNLLQQSMRLEQGSFPFRVIDPGMKFGLTMGYQYDL